MRANVGKGCLKIALMSVSCHFIPWILVGLDQSTDHENPFG
jgi:hypothetical protein